MRSDFNPAVKARPPFDHFSADLVYGAHDGDGAFGMTGEQLLEGGIEMTNIRLFRFLLMSKPHSPNGALAQYR